jgi:hypothetical protein
MIDHTLKTLTPFFEDIENGLKTFEVRINDRNFKVGDRCILLQWNKAMDCHEKGSIEVEITYILEGGQFGIEEGYIVFGFKVIEKS